MGFVENKYRKEAETMLSQVNQARKLFRLHKPSIGYIGEHILRQSLKRIVPNDFDICQGFVINNTKSKDEPSRQCDIIIFRKEKDAVYYSIDDLKVINSCSVVAIIEVKSSISKETFHSTMNAFEKLRQLGASNSYLFVYNKFSRKCLSNWLFSYRAKEDFLASDNYLYDWPDKEWLPKAIISLESPALYALAETPYNHGDWVGYLSYDIKDKENIRISSLQHFLSYLMHSIDCGNIKINPEYIEDNNGVPLFHS